MYISIPSALSYAYTSSTYNISHCPFCDPSLIKKRGQCKGHGVPEALCYQCNKVLILAFKKEGDWCSHNAPKSQCKKCKK